MSAWLNKLGALAQYPLPQHAISRLIYRLTRIESARGVPVAIRWFSRHFGVTLDEAQEPRPEAYRTFNAFFTRALKPEARPIDPCPDHWVSPVDGRVSALGKIERDSVFQAKGHDYSLRRLLGGEASEAQRFEQGRFATLYLSPRDYHRIHMPCEGRLRRMSYIPGRLFSVSPGTVSNVPSVFARNERVVAYFDTDHGPLAMILVGAMNVAAIETVWQGLITPPNGRSVRHWDYDGSQVLKRGEEMGRFNMGSTVILLSQSSLEWLPHFEQGTPTQVGQKLAKLQPHAD